MKAQFDGLSLELLPNGEITAIVWNRARDAGAATHLTPTNVERLRAWLGDHANPKPEPTND